jgi:SNF2 family DNA or RNA helicase
MFKYQNEALEWLQMREQDPVCRGGFLCHEMGLGKTWMMSSLIKKNAGRTLILTAKSTILGWCETLRAVGNFAFNVYEFSKPVELPDVPLVVVGTHQSILRNGSWFAEQHFIRIVVDEAHVMRNAGTRFHQRVVELARTVPIRWGMTATPFNNSDADIASYMRFLFPVTVVPDSKVFKWLMVRKTRADVQPDGPKLHVSKHVYEFEHPEEEEMYAWVSQRIQADQQWLMANQRRMPMHVFGAMILTLMLRQRQATIHPQLVLNAERRWRESWAQAHPVDDWNPERCTKMRHIVELIRADQKEGKSTMVVTHFKDEITMLEQMLQKEGIRVGTLNGKTSLADRRSLEKKSAIAPGYIGAILNQKNKLPADMIRHVLSYYSSPSVVLLQIKAGGVGISLPWVHHVINTSPDWNPFLEKQAMYRAYRITTPHDVRVTQVYLNHTIDGHIHSLQREKMMRSLYWTGDEEDSVIPFFAVNLDAQ